MRKNRLKLSIFCLIILCLVCVPFSKPVFNLISMEFTYCYYTSSPIIEKLEAKIVPLNKGSMIVCDSNNYSSIKQKLNNIIGESVSFSGKENKILEILNKLNATTIKKENINDIKVIYAYSPLLKDYCLIDGFKVNLQVAYNKGIITAGYPLILGSF